MIGVKENREWMKSNFAVFKELETDQKRQIGQPPLQKVTEAHNHIVDLTDFSSKLLLEKNLIQLLRDRRSHRVYSQGNMTMEELSFLLWATQGVELVKDNNYATLRPVPSGGARHPFETYIIINSIEGLTEGVYRYLPLSHQLIFLFDIENKREKISEAALGQKFILNGSVIFVWSCIPYRGEWRYDVCAHKTMLLDAGHLCQNLYIASEAIGYGTCAIAAYDQALMDSLLQLDGNDEFVVYLAPVGKIPI